MIFKDADLSGKANSVPNKPSVSGAHCSKIFKQRKSEGGSDKVWKDIVQSCKNFLSGGEAKRAQLEMWSSLDDLQQYFTKLTLTDEQRLNFKSKVENWDRLFIKCFSEIHVTHCMVRSITFLQTISI